MLSLGPKTATEDAFDGCPNQVGQVNVERQSGPATQAVICMYTNFEMWRSLAPDPALYAGFAYFVLERGMSATSMMPTDCAA